MKLHVTERAVTLANSRPLTVFDPDGSEPLTLRAQTICSIRPIILEGSVTIMYLRCYA